MRTPFARGRLAAGLLFLSGEGGIEPTTGAVVPGGIGPETRQTMVNIDQSLRAYGLTLDDVVSVVCYITDIRRRAEMDAEYVRAFGDAELLPARTTVEVADLAAGLSVEITVVAANG